jgi:hypothetical protein
VPYSGVALEEERLHFGPAAPPAGLFLWICTIGCWQRCALPLIVERCFGSGELVREAAAVLLLAAFIVGGCALDREPDSFAAQALQRGDDCKSVAAGRAMDAYANGFDRDTINATYSGTYKDCVSWRSTHPVP